MQTIKTIIRIFLSVSILFFSSFSFASAVNPPSCSISISPNIIKQGELSNLSVQVTGPVDKVVFKDDGILGYMGGSTYDISSFPTDSINYKDREGFSNGYKIKPGKIGTGSETIEVYGPGGTNSCSATITVVASGATTQVAKEFTGTLAKPAALYSCPSSTCKIIRYYAETAEMKIVGLDENSQWYEVKPHDDYGNELDGWIKYSLFTKDFRSYFTSNSSNQQTPAPSNNKTAEKTNSVNNLIIPLSFLGDKNVQVIFVSLLIAILILISLVLLRKKIRYILKRRGGESSRSESPLKVNYLFVLFKKKSFWVATISIVIILGVGLSVGILVRSFFKETQQALEQIKQTAEESKKQTAEESKTIITEAQNKADSEIAASQEKTKELEQKIQNLQQQQSSAPSIISTSLPTADINKIISSVVRVVCGRDANTISQGSGSTWKMSDGYVYIFTNAHVVATTDRSSPSCLVEFPQLPSGTPYYLYNVVFDSMNYQDNDDWALLKLSTPYKPEYTLPQIPLTSDYSKCKFSDVNIGDKVTVFGYPAVGGKNITVTEGNISGFSGNDYKISGIIDAGNSGGVAILNKNKCILGIPTWANIGEASSVGIVEGWRTIYNDTSY